METLRCGDAMETLRCGDTMETLRCGDAMETLRCGDAMDFSMTFEEVEQEGGGEPPVQQLSGETDPGLKRLLPLYQFLRNECADAAHLILVKGFRNAEYVLKYMRDDVSGVTFDNFLLEIQRNCKRTDQKGKKKQKGASSACQQEPQTAKRFTQIHNLCEHVDILKQVTIQDLKHQNAEDKCSVLRDLDLSFVLSVITNETIQYRLDESVRKAVIQIKEIRNKLFHPHLNFTQEDFDKNFDELLQATEILYSYATPGRPVNRQSMRKEYEKQVVEDHFRHKVLAKLRVEIHSKYGVLPTFVPPIIVDTSDQHERVVEDLPKFVQEHSDSESKKILPVHLCGAAGTGKSTVLRNLASSSILCDKYSLVLYLDDWDRRTNHRGTTNDIGSNTEFWEQIYSCIKRLARNTVSLHGFESVKAVVRECMNNALFLVNWNIQSYGFLFKEMQRGTWVVAHREIEPRTNDCQVLKIKPFTENLVAQLLRKCSAGYQCDVIHLYKNCEYKDILTSPDMVLVFSELKSTVNFGTDFELIEAFVKTKLDSRVWNVDVSKEILKLGEVAFNALKNGSKHVYKDKELCLVDSEVRNMFLTYHEDKGSQFIHSSVQEFLAAQYVVNQPKKACKGWLLSAPQFMKVFKFACSMWCKNRRQLDDVLCYMEEYLVELYDVISLKKGIENQQIGPMEVDGGKKRGHNCKKEKKPAKAGNPYKNPFVNWGYLIALDDACQGQPEILRLFVKLLSHIRCWTFKTNEINDRELRRIEIILKKVELTKESPVCIKLESRTDVTPLIKIWNKLKNIKSLHECSFIKISLARGIGFPFIEQGSLVNLSNTIVRAHCPVYITSYKGPLLCSTTPQFLKCMALLKLISIDVTVYDVASLSEILKCDDLPCLKYISVNVELKRDEQLLSEERDFMIPEHQSLKIKIKYFDNIQKLLDSAQSPHNLKSLSIYDLYVTENFHLDLTAFKCMENLNLRCEPCEDNLQRSTVDEHFRPLMDHEHMAVDERIALLPQKKRIPRHGWMLPLTVSLKSPKKLGRLLYRNMEFYNNSNNYLLLSILKTHCIQKLVILDSQLSLKGVRQVLSSHRGDEVDEIEFMTKKLKKNNLETADLLKLLSKKPRLSVEEREQKRKVKPRGKEIIITSEVEVCQTCCSFPCSCTVCDEMESRDTVDDLVSLIEDVYDYDIVSFNYTSKVVTVRKDVCGDVRVHCALPGLNDTEACHLTSSGSWLNRLFLTLTLAQCIMLDQTSLTFEGVKKIIDYLKTLKTEYSVEKMVEPFSLTIRSSYHPSDTSDGHVIDAFIDAIRGEKIFTTFNFWCSCEKKCFKIKKAHSGKMIYNDRMLHTV